MRIHKPYQFLGWSLRPLSSSTSRHSYTSAYASGIHSLNRLQREPYLHLPHGSNFCHTVSGRDLPDPHARTPGKQPSLWLLSQLLWRREGQTVKSGRGGILHHRWLFQSIDKARLGPSFCWQQTSTLICMLPAEVLVAHAGLRLPPGFVLQ